MFRFNSRVPLVRSSSETTVKYGAPFPYLAAARDQHLHLATGEGQRKVSPPAEVLDHKPDSIPAFGPMAHFLQVLGLD